MLNLSDKELDRLSREAAQEHDPGDVLGPRSWEKLEPRLDTDLGKTGTSPLRGIRRFPFYFVPAAVLLVAGVFFFARQNHRSGQNLPSASPPAASAPTNQPISLPKNSEHSTNSTPSANSSTSAGSTAVAHPDNTASANPNTTANTDAPAGSSPVASTTTSSAKPIPSTNTGFTTPGAPTTTNTAAGSARPGSLKSGRTGNNKAIAPNGAASTGNATTSNSAVAAADAATTAKATTSNPTRSNRHIPTSNDRAADDNATTDNTASLKSFDRVNTTKKNNTNTGSPAANGSGRNTRTNNQPSAATPRELTHATLPGRRQLRQETTISDSALRAYTAKTSTIQIGKNNKSLRIDRTLQFGLSLAPDFSSVNSQAGDKPGSTIGLTLDYQFANHWYLSTGLLIDRKNYAARAQDYHAPYDYYRLNGIHNLDFVKGSFSMLEIPLNLRYDFSVAGNTLFFASAGVSSYLFCNENSNFYFNSFGLREDCKSFNYATNSNYLFSSINLSLGVETGISDNFSLLVAPYIKIPSRNIGFGQVSMSSVGVTFAIKYAPVISKRRK